MADGLGSGDSLHGSMDQPEQEIRAVETDPSKRYTRYEQVLGRGAFKTVYKAFDEADGIEVAWNQVKVNDLASSPAEKERLFAEIKVLKQLKHKNIMTFYDSWLDQKNMTVNFITELFTSGTLRQYRKKHKHIDEQVLKRWAWHILQGLVYLHAHDPAIIHRDLKCDNIFVNGASGVIKIGDLGLATLWRGLTTPQSVLGTPEFMAPELYEECYDEKVDVYSFGMCMLELSTLEYPYSECRNAAQIYKKVTQGIQPAGLEKVKTSELRDFISLCIAHDPRQRPEARQLLKNSFFDSIRLNKPASVPHLPERLSGELQERSRTPSSSGDSESDECPSPKSHATQLINLAEMEQLSKQEDMAEQQAIAAAEGAGGAAAVASSSAAAVGNGVEGVQVQVLANGGGSAQLQSFDSAGARGSIPSGLENGHGASPGGGEGLEDELEDDGDRDLCVNCQESEENKLSFQLKFTEPEGHCKTVEFTFDMREDTAECIASEMMEDLSLTRDEAEFIAAKIKEEVKRISAKLVNSLALNDEAGYASAAAAAASDDPLVSSMGYLAIDPSTKEAVAANAAAQAVAAVAAAVAANSFTGNSGIGMTGQLQHVPAATASSTKTAGALTPLDNNRPPSYHDLVMAMRQYHEQQMAADEAQRVASGSGSGPMGTDPRGLEAPPLEVKLPNGHLLDPALLAKVAATAATAAVQQLEDAAHGMMAGPGVGPSPEQQQQQQSPAFHVTGYTESDHCE